MGTWINVIAVVAGLLGLLLLLRGLLGRRVGTAPHCRNCRFDLTALYPEHQVCPECGTELTGPRATTRGLRRRRWVVFALGVLLLAITATIGTMAARGAITKAKIADALPTGALISFAVDRPNGWLSDECADELVSRVSSDTLSPAQCDRLVDALIRELGRPDFRRYEYNSRVLGLTADAPSAPIEARQRYADFLLDRVVRTDLPWMSDWARNLMRLRADGVVTDEAWEHTLTQLITPRLWCSSGDTVEPGEVFVVRTSFLVDRLGGSAGGFALWTDAVDGVASLPDAEPVAADALFGGGAPNAHRLAQQMLVARDEPWSGDVAFRVWYDEGVIRVTGTELEHAFGYPNPGVSSAPKAPVRALAVSAESRLPLEVRPVTPPAVTADVLTIEEWLRRHLLPASTHAWSNARPVPQSYPDFYCTIGVLAPVGTVALRGKLVTVRQSGSRTAGLPFRVERHMSNQMVAWMGSNSGTVYSKGFRDRSDTLSEFRIKLPGECLLPETRARALFLFDHVTLPDGRTFDAKESGAAPIEIEVPLDPDAGGFHW